MELLTSKTGTQILFRKLDSKLVDFRYVVKVGALDETPAQEGYSHFIEHMLFNGTKNRDWQTINRDCEKIGTWIDGFTELETTSYQIGCLKDYWKEAFEILADTLYNPTFLEERWEQIEKPTLISEIQISHDDEYSSICDKAFRDALGTNYHDPVGNIKVLKKTKIKDLKKFYDTHYRGSNITLLVTGDLTKQELLKIVNTYDQNSRRVPPKKKKHIYSFNYKTLNMARYIEQSILYLCKPINVPRTLRSKISLEIGINCLNQYLFEELRERKGLCYEVSAELEWGIPDNLFLCISTSSSKESFKKIERNLKASLNSFLHEGLSKERIVNLKLREIYGTIGDKENIKASADWMWDAYQDQVYADPFESYLDILNALNTSNIKHTTQRALEGKMKITKMESEN